jgi:two-component system response regulator (stage 0 sporulation protein F)
MAQKRIMVVDDDKNIRNLIVQILSKYDYDLVQVSNGEACLKRLEEQSVDCVLLDLQLPGMDGTETLKAIKKRYEHLPVIIMTAHGTIERAGVGTLAAGIVTQDRSRRNPPRNPKTGIVFKLSAMLCV